MVKTFQEYVQNFIKFRQESKRIQKEIDNDGIYKYVEKNYGFGDKKSKVLKTRNV